ncbi:MAG: ion channel [Planctomycetota bacterium]
MNDDAAPHSDSGSTPPARPNPGHQGSVRRFRRGDTGYMPSSSKDTELMMVPTLLPTQSGKLEPVMRAAAITPDTGTGTRVPPDAEPVTDDATSAPVPTGEPRNPRPEGDTTADTRQMREQTVQMKAREGWGEPWAGGVSVTIDGQRFNRISDEEALARIIRGESLEGCHVKALHLGYQTDNWVRPADIGTTRYLARHFKVPEQIKIEESDEIRVLKYTHPVRIIGCHIESFSAVGVAFHGEFEMRNTRIAGSARLSPPDADDATRETTVIPPTSFEAPACIAASHVDNDLHIERLHTSAPLDLRETRIGGSVYAALADFGAPIDGTGMRLGNDLHADGARFGGGINLSATRIADKVSMTKAHFGGELTLHSATLGSVNLTGVRLEAGINAQRATVAGEFTMRSSQVAGETDLQVMRTDDDVTFSDTVFNGPVNCYRMKCGNHLRAVNTKFLQMASFRDTQAHDSADFRNAEFQEPADFRRGYFRQWAIFFSAKLLKGADFFGARFEGECLFNRGISARRNWGDQLLDNAATVGGPLSFSGAYFYRSAVFDGVTFPDAVDFDHAYFAEPGSFCECEFKALADYSDVLVTQELDFSKSTFHGLLTLEQANISGPIDLGSCRLTRFACAGAQLDCLIVERWQIENAIDCELRDGTKKPPAEQREEYTLLKASFSRRGKLDEEDWAHACFKRAQRRALLQRIDGTGPEPKVEASENNKRWMRVKSTIEMVIFDWFTEYGTNPNRTFFLALLMIACFGLFYTAADLMGEPLVWSGDEFTGTYENGVLVGWENQSVVSRLFKNTYFSFMAFTTMGFGDVHPNFDGWVKFIVAIEAFLGVFLMTLFVGTYARKIIR